MDETEHEVVKTYLEDDERKREHWYAEPLSGDEQRVVAYNAGTDTEREVCYPPRWDDAQFIAAAHEVLPALLGDQNAAVYEQLKVARSIIRAQRLIFQAWLQDRREQYEPDSGAQALLDELIHGVRKNEPLQAFLHGELDDLLDEEERIFIRDATIEEQRLKESGE